MRKTAAICVAKLYDLNPELVEVSEEEEEEEEEDDDDDIDDDANDVVV